VTDLTDSRPAAWDPAIREWVNRGLALTAQQDHPAAATPAETRADALSLSDALFAEYGAPGDATVVKVALTIPGPGGVIRAYAYSPPGPSPTAPDAEPLPALLLFHGGAWCHGEIDAAVDDSLARHRAVQGGCVVFDINYRLAPEHPFPAGLEDAYAALTWVADHAPDLGVDAARIAVNGSSAGGNLAAALCLLARDRGGPAIVGQVLEAPVTDLTRDEVWEVECPDNSNGLGTTIGLREAYLQGADPTQPYVSPLLAPDLSGLPAAHIITAQVDPLYPEGLQYAERLRAAGVSVTASWHWTALHGSAGIIGRFRGARLWQAEVAAALRDLFADQSGHQFS
jgi:acetyl esterase